MCIILVYKEISIIQQALVISRINYFYSISSAFFIHSNSQSHSLSYFFSHFLFPFECLLTCLLCWCLMPSELSRHEFVLSVFFSIFIFFLFSNMIVVVVVFVIREWVVWVCFVIYIYMWMIIRKKSKEQMKRKTIQ